MNNYYVYAYLRNITSQTGEIGTPYYIGKGKARRAYKHHGNVPVPKDKANIRYIAKDLSENEAYLLEKIMIKLYGRKDLQTGILHNRTDGGEKAGHPCSEETKRKKSIFMKTKQLTQKEILNRESFAKKPKTETDLQRIKQYQFKPGIKHPEEVRLKAIAARIGKSTSKKGQKMTQEQKVKISQSNQRAWIKRKERLGQNLSFPFKG